MSTTFFNASPDLNLRARSKALWESGDFGVVAKYNELLRIEEELGSQARYAGEAAFYNLPGRNPQSAGAI